MGWTNADISKITVKNATSPGDSFTFDGMAAAVYSDVSMNDANNPGMAYSAIQMILDIGGLSAVRAGITRTVKQGDDSQ